MATLTDFSVELLEIVSKQPIIVYSIEQDDTSAHDLYNESTEKGFRQPVRTYARVEYADPEQAYSSFGPELKRRISAYFLKYRLHEIGLVIRVGDYLDFNSTFFEVTSVVEPAGYFGLPQYHYAILVNAVQVREEVFSPHKPGIYNEGTINNDSDI